MLNYPQLIAYLLQCDLVSPHSLVAGELEALNASRRNSNFRVIREDGPSYLLKQGIGPERAATLANEAAAYAFFHSDPAGRAFRRYVPALHLYRPQEKTLVLELYPHAEDLGEYHLRRGRFSVALAERLGLALGTLHSLIGAGNGNGLVGLLSLKPPILYIHSPNLGMYSRASFGNMRLIRIIQQFPDFCSLLEELRAEWRPETLIHGDLKWGNCIVYKPGPGKRRKLKIVDWETAQIGDPCYDVGSVFNSYLSFWLLSIPITGEDPPDRFLQLARYPLEKMQPAIRAFWEAYVRRMNLDPDTANEWLVRSVRYCAARLVQTAYEEGQVSTQITGNAVCMLQLAYNILKRPEEAATHLLGIPVGVPAWAV